MTFIELQKKAAAVYPAVLLERYMSHNTRVSWKRWLFITMAILFVIMVLSAIFSTIPAVHDAGFFQILFRMTYIIRGVFFLSFIAWLIVYLFDAMYFSYFFRKENELDFSVAKIVYATKPDDVTGAFLTSTSGLQLMLRLGIPIKTVRQFLEKRKSFVTTDEYEVIANDDEPYVTIAEYARSLIHFDPDFAAFLKQHGISGDIFKGAIDWVGHNQRRVHKDEAWWKPERLQRIPSIGRDWAYGQIYYLDKYSHPITSEGVYAAIAERAKLYADDVHALEQILLKNTGANVMLVADQSVHAMTIVAALAHGINKGTVHYGLEDKRMVVLDPMAIIDALREKVNIEEQLTKMFVQASNAGNVILVIPDIPSFVESAASLEVDVLDILGHVLDAQRLQVIATAPSRGFHESVEVDRDVMRHFERVMVKALDNEALQTVLETQAFAIEQDVPVIFTRQAVDAVATAGTRFFEGGAMTERSVGILEEVAAAVMAKGERVVLVEDVDTIVAKRTGVPQGALSDEERTTLQNLETILHERIIGQDMAITALASALRRARAGLTNPNRPMGSFLFLGPTGVGKTETTKALAATFFESEKDIVRIDMSEYSSDEGLEKLIGSFETEKPGVLSSALREKPYGVLLLDEFEKASTEVHDLFLQILDEGYFTDGRGEKVNARNLIIIATSNAGSDIIYEMTQAGNDASVNPNTIIDTIIERQIFRPELMNRFDGTIIFHALTETELASVAKLMLKSLERRLADKNITIVQTPELIQYLVRIGTDKKFGARAMNRAIQNEVERVIADGLIAGSVQPGNDVTLVPQINGTSLEVKTA